MHVELFSYQKMIVFTIISLISCNHRERQDLPYGWTEIYMCCLHTNHLLPCDSLLGKPFWISDRQQHKLENTRTKGKCCLQPHNKTPPERWYVKTNLSLRNGHNQNSGGT